MLSRVLSKRFVAKTTSRTINMASTPAARSTPASTPDQQRIPASGQQDSAQSGPKTNRRSRNEVRSKSQPPHLSAQASPSNRSQDDWRRDPVQAALAEERFRSEGNRRSPNPQGANRSGANENGRPATLSFEDQMKLHGRGAGSSTGGAGAGAGGGGATRPRSPTTGHSEQIQRSRATTDLDSRRQGTHLINAHISSTSSPSAPARSFPPPTNYPSPREYFDSSGAPSLASLPPRPSSVPSYLYSRPGHALQPGQKKPPRRPHPRRPKHEGPNGRPDNERRKEDREEMDDEAYASSADESGEILARFNKAPNSLTEEILTLYNTQRASPVALEARRYLISELMRILNSVRFQWGRFHNPRQNPLIIEPFGSVRFGLATSTSDLDLCLFDPYRPNGYDSSSADTAGKPDSLPEIYDMRRIAIILKKAGFFNITAIPFAGVPIVKFEAKIGNEIIQADLNTNERFGVLNSRLINAYCDLHPLVRPLSVFIKFWARQRRLNDPSGSSGITSFSSYTLILLVIAYLQTLNVLPNLQSPELIASAGIPHSAFWTTPKKSTRGRKSRESFKPAVGWDVTFVEKMPRDVGWSGRADVSMNELVKGFFRFYADEFACEEWIVSVQNGRPLRRERPFGDLQGGGNGAGNGNGNNGDANGEEGGMSAEESRRQREEDLAMEALVEEMENVGTSSTAPPTREEQQRLDKQEERRAREEEESRQLQRFVEPANWTQKLVVQDPFLLTRNTATNVTPDVVEMLRLEMQRASTLIDEGASLSTICASIKGEDVYRSHAQLRLTLRKQRGKGKTVESRKLEEGLPALEGVDVPVVQGAEVALLMGVEEGERREMQARDDGR